MRHRLPALLFALAIVACDDRGERAPQRTTAVPDTGGTLVIAIPNEPDAVNSLLSGERYGQEINRNILYLPLVTYDEEQTIVPVLAQSWQMHGDTAVTFNLRRDVFWHDGARTTAHDVVFTFERGKDPATGYPNADYWVGWNSAQAIDSFTVRFSMEVQPEPLGNFAWIPIMPRHLLGNVAPAELKNAPFNQRPVGNGPFKFVEHRANDRWVFEANTAFPAGLGGRPLVDRVVLRVIPDPTAQQTELRTGNVHMITLVGVSEFAALDQQPQVRGIVKPGRQYSFIAWNTKRAPFSDVRFRRALTFAIDRDEIVKIVRSSYGQVAAGPVPPFHWSNDSTIKPLAFQPDSARAILAALGMRDINNDGYVELPNGRALQVELKFGAGSQAQRDVAEIVQADLKDVGIRLVQRPMEFSTMLEQVTTAARNFDGVIMGYENDFKLVLHDMFHSRAVDNPYQFASYRNSEVDSLLDALNRTTSRDQAVPMWRRLQTIIRDEQPWTFLFNYSELMAAREEVRGPSGDVRGILVDLKKWWLDRPDSTTTN
ncbi:MAG TPA: ABC transporter substrate-binding protein [Longimicrobiales bacterium]